MVTYVRLSWNWLVNRQHGDKYKNILNFMPQSSFVYENVLIYFVVFNFIKFQHAKQAKFHQLLDLVINQKFCS
jgi:hypothetical protein